MASAGDTARSINHGFDPLGLTSGFEGLLGPTDAEKQAAKLQQQALQNAQDQLAFDKGVYNANQGTVDSALQSIFGNNPLPSTSLPASQVGTGTGPAIAPASASTSNPAVQSLSSVGNPYNLQDTAGNGYDSSGNFTGANFSLPAAVNTPATSTPATGNDVVGTSSALTQGPSPFAGGLTATLRNPNGLSFFTPQSAATPAAQVSPTRSQGGLAAGYGAAESGESAAANQLAQALNGIKDPTLAAYTGDINNAANVSPEARAAETQGMQSLSGMTGVKETAAEKLQRMLAQRQMENQEKGSRDAMVANLKSRGVYGAGDELSKQLLSQQNLASTRALQEAAANAGAVNRSMQASGMLGNLGTAVGNQDLNAGSIANQVNESNQSLKEAHNLNEAKQQAQNNQAASARAATVANAQNNVAGGKRTDTNNLISTLTNLTGQKTGAANTNAGLQNNAYQDLGNAFHTQAASVLANDPTTKAPLF